MCNAFSLLGDHLPFTSMVGKSNAYCARAPDGTVGRHHCERAASSAIRSASGNFAAAPPSSVSETTPIKPLRFNHALGTEACDHCIIIAEFFKHLLGMLSKHRPGLRRCTDELAVNVYGSTDGFDRSTMLVL